MWLWELVDTVVQYADTVCTKWLSSPTGLVLRALLRINPQYNMLFHHWLSRGLILGYTREFIFRLRQKTAKTLGQSPQNLCLAIYWVLKPSLTHSIIKILITQE